MSDEKRATQEGASVGDLEGLLTEYGKAAFDEGVVFTSDRATLEQRNRATRRATAAMQALRRVLSAAPQPQEVEAQSNQEDEERAEQHAFVEGYLAHIEQGVGADVTNADRIRAREAWQRWSGAVPPRIAEQRWSGHVSRIEQAQTPDASEAWYVHVWISGPRPDLYECNGVTLVHGPTPRAALSQPARTQEER
jgi:hypothetical protein